MMSQNIRINPNPNQLRTVDARLVSYNIEMTEVTGGTFWKAYTPGQIAGTEPFTVSGEFTDFTAMADLMQVYPPINLYDEKLRRQAKALGPAWIRVSGTWATKTYYDFDGTTNGNPPAGYASVLTKEQWIGVLDFVKAVGGKLLISVSNCAGDHPDNSALDLTQTKKIFDFSHAYGVDINAAEFMNEPNLLTMSGTPQGYTASDYARDQDIFFGWVKENYPDCLLVGPCSLGEGDMGKTVSKTAGAGIGSMMPMCTTDDLMRGTKVPMDVFSYHYYNGVSERLASMLPEGHWSADEAHTDAYLDVAPANARAYAPMRDKYVPGGQMWVTESGDAGGGGCTWACTYLDVLRTLHELGSFCKITDGVIFHNTLASYSYGYLEHGTFAARPNYYAVLLWNRLMGSEVFDSGVKYVFCHSRRDGQYGYAMLVLNNSLTDEKTVVLPDGGAEVYLLHGRTMRDSVMYCGETAITEESAVNILPEHRTGTVTLPAGACAFIITG